MLVTREQTSFLSVSLIPLNDAEALTEETEEFWRQLISPRPIDSAITLVNAVLRHGYGTAKTGCVRKLEPTAGTSSRLSSI